MAKVKLMVRVEEDYENGKLSFDAARAMLEERVGSCTPAEIALAEQMFTEEDPDQCRKEDIQGKLALFEGILQTGMEGRRGRALCPERFDDMLSDAVSADQGRSAAIGAVAFVPGSDMPLMTARQIRLALDITAAYNINVSVETIAELLGVVGAGFGYRTVARTVAVV